MNVEIVERPEMKAAVLRIPRDGHLVRDAWKKVSALLNGHPAVADRDHGYVFIPEWQWATEVTTLWVGMAVHHFDALPDGLETVTIPAKRFAKLTVRGDRSHMEESYRFLFDWFGKGPYERDVREGSYGYEANRLYPVNPFEISADAINSFDYDIYVPIKEAEAPHPFPGVIGVEMREGRPRRLVGVETFIDRKEQRPEQAIPRLWQKVLPRIGEIKDRKQPYSTIGVYLYDPPFGPGQNFRYFAGVEVEPDSPASIPEGMMERNIPGDDCVVMTYRGRASEFGQVWDYFHGFWYPQQSEYDVIDEYEFECHDERFLGTDNALSVYEMHFPVRKRVQDVRLTDRIVVDEKGGHVLQDLRGRNVRMVSFQGANFHGVDMRDAALRHVNFVHSDWQHIYFANVRTNEIQMGGTIFENIRRPDAKESRFEEEPGTAGWVNVEPVIFRSSDLRTARFENCDLRDVDIRGCQLDGMRIDGISVTELLENWRRAARTK